MPEGDRIKSEIKIDYKAINSKGDVTLMVDAHVVVADQSPAAASAHLSAIVDGMLLPASKQAGDK